MLEALKGQILGTHKSLWVFLGHFWSLAVEEQFYLAWPLVVFTVKDRVKLRNICIVVVAAMPLIRLLVGPLVPLAMRNAEFFYRVTPFRVDALLLGGLLALIIRGPEENELRPIAPYLAIGCAVILVIVPLLTTHLLHLEVPIGARAPWMGAIGFTVIDLLSACIIWMCLQSGTYLFKLLSIRPLRKLGEISYGFYVFHDIPHALYWAIAHALVGHGHPIASGLILIPLAFGCTLALSVLSHRFFERPFLRLKDRLAPS
jgi:peptidoglycan/LPS O-acetylase OafA/YrhL